MTIEVTYNVFEPADSYALISLPTAKIMLGIDSADNSADAQLKVLIDQNSAIIANLCDRIFGLETLEEAWSGIEYRPNGSRWVYLTHAPVRWNDLNSVASPDGTPIDLASVRLEEKTGRLTLLGGGVGDIVVNYKGGYALPTEAPLDLQQCAGLLVRQFRTEAATAGTVGSGIRMIAHKDSRIMYHSPKDLAAAGTSASSGGGASVSASSRAVNDILLRYKRIWI